MAEAGETPGTITAEIDLSAVDKARGQVPSLKHDRDYAHPQPNLRVAGE